MSSILRALKKLDEDALAREEAVSEDKIKMRRIIHRRTRSPLLSPWFLSLVGVVLLLGTGALYIIHINTRPSQPRKQEESLKKTAMKHSYQQAIPLEKESKKESKREEPGETLPKETPPPAVVRVPEKTNIEPGYPAKAQPRPSVPGSENKILQPSGNSTFTNNIIPQRNPADVKKQPPHPELVLNGVLWSENPQRRAALINLQYVKEGETISGVKVVKIGKKEVTLQSGDVEWTLMIKQ